MVRFGVDGKELHWSLYNNNSRVIDTNNYHSMTATYMSGAILSILANIRSLVPLNGQL